MIRPLLPMLSCPNVDHLRVSHYMVISGLFDIRVEDFFASRPASQNFLFLLFVLNAARNAHA